MIATRETARSEVLARYISRDRLLSGLGLGSALSVSVILNVWNLAQNGFSNTYYSVAVQSMLQNWRNFFFVSYDAGGFISVDKPPVALWIQALSARIFGFSGMSLLLPEALAGVVAAGLLYYLVYRVFGILAAFLAAMALAVTPVAVAVERTNNTDTWLMLAILLAVWALTLAIEKGRLAHLLLAMALVGVAFNIKMLAAFVILPAFCLLYLLAAPLKWYRRLLNLSVASIVLVGVSLSWAAVVDLTPAAARPWVGGSQANNVLDLALNYNGLGRVTGVGEGIGGRGSGRFGLPPGFPFGNNGGRGGLPFGRPQPSSGGGVPGGRGSFGGGGSSVNPALFSAGFAGPLRLFGDNALPDQWSWLFPLALFGLLAAVASIGGVPAGPPTPRRLPLERRGTAILLWSGWLASYGVVFSMAEGIFHPYYLIMLAPAAAALVGIGVAAVWSAYGKGGWQAWLLPLALLATAFWQAHVLSPYPEWSAWLVPATLAGSLVTAVSLAVIRLGRKGGAGFPMWRRWAPGFVAAGLIALVLSPVMWAVLPVVAAPNNASLPIAGPSALAPPDDSGWTQTTASANSGFIQYLTAESSGYYYLVAVTNSQQASSLTLESGKPVLALAGFMGTDPALTPAKLEQMVSNRQLRFVLLGGSMGGNGSVSSWVQSSCSDVDPSLWSPVSGTIAGGFARFGGAQLYDCAP